MEKSEKFAIELSKKFDKELVQEHFNGADISLLKLILSELKGDRGDYLFNFDQLESLGFDLARDEKELFNSLEKIANYYVNIQNGYGDSYKIGLIDNKFTIDKEMKILSVKVHKEIVPFLNSLKEQYMPLIDIEE